jgi:hypothetical protein
LDRSRQQTAFKSELLDQEDKVMDNIYRQKTFDQSNQYFQRMKELDPSDTENYLTKRAALNAELPLGSMNPAVEKHLGMLDKVHDHMTKQQQTIALKMQERVDKANQSRLDQAWKLAEKMGPQVLEEFSVNVGQNPEMAMRKVASMAGAYQRGNTLAQLRQTGMTDEAIQRKYLFNDPETGQQFFAYDAAAADIESFRKHRAASSRDRAAATRSWVALKRLKAENEGTDNWTEANEQALQDAETILMDMDQPQGPASGFDMSDQAPSLGGSPAQQWQGGQTFTHPQTGQKLRYNSETGKYQTIE